MKFLPLSFIFILLLNVVGTAQAYAQSSKHTMDRIRKSLATAEIDLPDDVMRQLEDLQIESAELSRDEKRAYSENVSYKSLPAPQSALQSESFAREITKLKNDYVTSHSYKAYRQKEDALSEKSLALVAPYIAEREAPPPKRGKKTREEEIAYIRRLYADEYGVSLTDLEQLINFEKETTVLNERFKDFWNKPSSPEHQQLRSEIMELRKKKRQIFRPYKKKHSAKQQARKNIRRALAPKNIRISQALIRERKSNKQIARIEKSEGIKLSNGDRETLTSLFNDLESLTEEAALAQPGRTTEISSLKKEEFKSRHANIENRMKAILQPYQERQSKK